MIRRKKDKIEYNSHRIEEMAQRYKVIGMRTTEMN